MRETQGEEERGREGSREREVMVIIQLEQVKMGQSKKEFEKKRDQQVMT